MKGLLYTIGSILFMVLVTHCASNKGKEDVPVIIGSCDTVSVSYTVDIVPILNANCTGCHSTAGATGGVVLDTYQGVKNQVDAGSLVDVLTGANGASVMPPSGSLSPDAIRKITCWVENGALNN